MYKLYSDIKTHETFLELWGASTKHPDSKFNFKNFKTVEWIDPQFQIIPWIFECASKMSFPPHSYELSKWACGIYEKTFINTP